MTNKFVGCCTGQNQRTQHGPDGGGKSLAHEPQMINLTDDMFEKWANQYGNPSVFAAIISVVVDQAMRRRLAGPIAEVLRRNADILEAAAVSRVQRQPQRFYNRLTRE